MGSALSLFRSPDYFDVERVVDDLDVQLQKLNLRRSNKQSIKQSINRALVLYSTAIFFVLIAALYAYISQSKTQSNSRNSQILSFIFVAAFPLIVYLIKKIINISINLSIKRDEQVIDRLESRRKTIVNQFLEKSKYKEMQRIVDKLSKSKPASPTLRPVNNLSVNQSSNQSKLQTPGKPINSKNTPAGKSLVQSNNRLPSNGPTNQANQSGNQLVNRPNNQLVAGQPYATHGDLTRFARADVMQAPVKRSVLDKFVDFVLNDGPNHRYALICSNCFTHNGLVRPEDYDAQLTNQSTNQSTDRSTPASSPTNIKQKVVRFRCCYCQAINGPPLPTGWQPSVNTGLIIQSTPIKQSDRPLTMAIDASGGVQSINQTLADLSSIPSTESSPVASPIERSRAPSAAETDEKSEQLANPSVETSTINQSINQSIDQPIFDVKLVPIVEPSTKTSKDKSTKDEKTQHSAGKAKKRR